jgi:thioredoxin 2
MPMIVSCKQCGQKNRVLAKHLSDTGRCGNCKNALPAASEPLRPDVAEFDEIVAQSKVPVLVDFWAEWCGPCKRAAPEVERTAANSAGRALVLKVDTEQYPQLAARYNVRGIPNFVVFHNGKLVMQQAGLVGHDVMESWLKSASNEA